MAFAFHTDPELYFRHQFEHARDFVLPFIRQQAEVGPGRQVLEIGCGEGGVLKAFLEEGCTCLGIDLSAEKIAHGEKLLQDHIQAGKMQFLASDIYAVETEKLLDGRFDLIVLKDTIEHIFDQGKIIRQMKRFLRPGGQIFYGYPPWYMPFGGHQQITRSKLLSRLPWYHLLPVPLYRFILKAFGEAPECVKELLEIKSTGISTARFERLHTRNGYQIVARRLYLINPIYAWKFGLQPRELPGWLAAIPFFRDFLCTTAWYLVKPKS